MTDRQSIRKGLGSWGEINELSEVTTFTGYRKGKRVTVRILDRGPDCDKPELRFACEVEQEDGKKAAGNEAGTADVAISIVIWQKLD